MRMAGPDIVLFVVGALLFGGALTAIVVTQGPEAFTGTASASGAFTVSYPLAMKELAKKAVSPSNGKADFDVNGSNVASIHVKLTCSDSVPGDTFALTLTITGPQGQKATKSASCGAGVDLPVKVQDPPANTTVAGSTDEAAKANLPANPNATAGVGKWTVAVTGSRNAGPAGALPVPIAQADPTAQVSFMVETFAAKLDPVAK